MIDIRKHIYDMITGDATITGFVGSEVHIFQDGKDVRDDYEDKFPQITYGRYAGTRVKSTGVRVEFFQISAWAKTLSESEQIGHELVRLFNRNDNNVHRACRLESFDNHYDEVTKSYGTHLSLSFVIYDPDY